MQLPKSNFWLTRASPWSSKVIICWIYLDAFWNWRLHNPQWSEVCHWWWSLVTQNIEYHGSVEPPDLSIEESGLWSLTTIVGVDQRWCWTVSNNDRFTSSAAPEDLLKIIRCNCLTNCQNARCSCIKHGIKCSVACGHCHGSACSNAGSFIVDEDEDEDGQWSW